MKLKGIDEYLECAKIIRSKYKNAVFYIAGWNEEERYKKLVKSYEGENIVKYIGFRKDINTWIKKSSCVILPSHGGEGVPNVLLEAAAMGRPCIASRINGSKDVVTDGVTGYLFEPKNVNDLKDKVERFINLSYDEKVKMGQSGRSKIEKEFNRQIVIDKYLSIVESVKNDNVSVRR